MKDDIYDIAIIGGGINGMGIARDAAGRGLSVLLLEKSDFASATSSSSTKLIHGGLRYLEYYEFGLVRAALKEREVLLDMAPHIIWPLEFILPHSRDMRPAWLIRLGLFLYDHLGGRKKLPASKMVKLNADKIKPRYHKGFSYADCWVDDARMVILNAIDAREHGADIYNYTPCEGAICEDGLWRLTAGGALRGKALKARQLVNAAGPWVRDFLDGNDLAEAKTHKIRLVKGSHIITKRLFDGDECYILQQADGRIVFIIPYEDEFSLIGTTDVEYQGDPAAVTIEDSEVDYLCRAVNLYINAEISPKDVVASYSGVRPLLDSGEDNASAVTRDYVLERSDAAGAPLLSIFGGKITTYRALAEKALSGLTARAPWTKDSILPGGLDGVVESAKLAPHIQKLCSDLDKDGCASLATRWARQYGSRAHILINVALKAEGGCGINFGCGLYQAEVDYLMRDEFAVTADDILWRRTKLGLHFTDAQRIALENYIKTVKA
jgi:glycerol-3-phosphate dehydrogenase